MMRDITFIIEGLVLTLVCNDELLKESFKKAIDSLLATKTIASKLDLTSKQVYASSDKLNFIDFAGLCFFMKKVRTLSYCETCDKVFTTKPEAHEKTKAHQKKLEKSSSAKPAKAPDASDFMECEDCECTVKKSYFNKHVKTKKHIKNAGGGMIIPPDDDAKSDSNSEPPTSESDTTYCVVCDCSVKLSSFKRHLSTKKHLNNKQTQAPLPPDDDESDDDNLSDQSHDDFSLLKKQLILNSCMKVKVNEPERQVCMKIKCAEKKLAKIRGIVKHIVSVVERQGVKYTLIKIDNTAELTIYCSQAKIEDQVITEDDALKLLEWLKAYENAYV